MHSFKDFGITIESKGFEGEKIKIEKLLNKPIEVHGYKIVDSIFEGKGKCLHLQIIAGSEKRVVFSSSKRLMEQLSKIPTDGFPFKATIVKENERLEFT